MHLSSGRQESKKRKRGLAHIHIPRGGEEEEEEEWSQPPPVALPSRPSSVVILGERAMAALAVLGYGHRAP